MATTPTSKPQDHQQTPPSPPPPPPFEDDLEGQTTQTLELEVEAVDFSNRAQLLRAAVLGAIVGLLSTAPLMMGAGAASETMAITGMAGLIGGTIIMAIEEFLAVYSQYDIEVAHMKRENRNGHLRAEEMEASKAKLLSPWQAAGASALAFAVGALVPLLAGVFIKEYRVRLAVVIAVVSLTLVGFGWLSAILGKAPVVKSISRVLAGGWLAMGINFALTKIIGS